MKRHVNINRPPLSPGEIARYKNFNTVFTRYRKGGKPIFRKPWFYGNAFLITAAVVSLVLYLDRSEQELTSKTSENDSTFTKTAEAPFINPPLEGVNVEYSSFMVNSAEGAELNYNTGSKIQIPKDAFVDENGSPVKGEIEIRYREFHDPVDFFVSGIPMTYDSAGLTYNFESAGMMEILAFKENKPVFLHAEKNIKVELASRYNDSDYNIYFLDSSKKNWECGGKDMVVQASEEDKSDATASVDTSLTEPKPEVKKLIKEMESVKSEIASIKKTCPQEPKKANKMRYNFNINFDPKERPELDDYKDVRFEVGEENTHFTSRIYKITWDGAELAEKEKGKSYLLTLSKGTEKQTFVVYPVFEGKSLEEAKKKFTDKFKVYQEKLKEKQETEEKLAKEYEEKVKKIQLEIAEAKKKWEEEKIKMEKEQEARMLSSNNAYSVRRLFEINRFGVWNCDAPRVFPKEAALAARFCNDQQEPISLPQIYLVEKNRNMMFIYDQSRYNSLYYNFSSKNMIWGVTAQNELAVYSYDDFAAIPRNKGVHTFKMKTAKYKFNSIEELKKFLNIEA